MLERAPCAGGGGSVLNPMYYARMARMQEWLSGEQLCAPCKRPDHLRMRIGPAYTKRMAFQPAESRAITVKTGFVDHCNTTGKAASASCSRNSSKYYLLCQTDSVSTYYVTILSTSARMDGKWLDGARAVTCK